MPHLFQLNRVRVDAEAKASRYTWAKPAYAGYECLDWVQNDRASPQPQPA